MLKLLIIFNPHAGSGQSLTHLADIENHLNQSNINYQLMHTEQAGDAKTAVQTAQLSAYDGVVAAGGDGTLFEVINGLMSHDAEDRIPLGIIPVGTGNAFARELGLQPTDWQAGIDLILHRRFRDIDVGEVQTATDHFYFLNIIGLGFVVQAGRSTMKIKKLGKSSYTLATLWETIRLKKYPLKLQMTLADGQVEQLHDDLVFVEVANSRYTGTSFLIAPDAQIDDGLLDVIILKKISRFKILRLFPSIYSGKHVNYPEVETRQVKSISIESEQPMPLMPDGEFYGETPIQISCQHQALQIFY